MELTSERDAVLDWLAAEVDSLGGPCCIPERERWEMYEAAKRRLLAEAVYVADYEPRVRALAAMLDL
jgi:hypothetical protein